MSTPKDSSIIVPAELVKKTVGLSIDFGGSVFKVVYRSKENKKEVEENNAEFGHLQLVAFPRNDWEKGLDYLKEHADITRDGKDLPTIHTTGVGCTTYGKIISDSLSVQLQQATEFDCFVNSFTYLAAKLSRSDFLEPFESEAATESIASMMEQLSFRDTIQSLTKADFAGSQQVFDPLMLTGQIKSEPTTAPLAESEEIYPCLLAMCGSGFGYIQVNKDKTFRIIDASNRGGRAFYGIGRLLTDCKNFDELVDLASKGNRQNVDVFSNDLFTASGTADGDESLYAKAATVKHPPLIYSFGKCVGPEKREDFKREDLARAWVDYLALDIVQCLHLLCLLNGIKRIFFCGSFCNTPLVRKALTAEFAHRNIGAAVIGLVGASEPVHYDFIKPGAHLGAIGAMIKTFEN